MLKKNNKKQISVKGSNHLFLEAIVQIGIHQLGIHRDPPLLISTI